MKTNTSKRVFFYLFFILVFSTHPMFGQNTQQLQTILDNFEKASLPFTIDGNKVNSIYTKLTKKDSAYLWDLYTMNKFEIVNPLYESGFGSLDDETDYLEEENILSGGSIIPETGSYILVCFRINEVGVLMSLDAKTGNFISGLISENYRGMGHAQIGRAFIIDKERTIKIEESSWGRNLNPEFLYSLEAEYKIDHEGYFQLTKLNFQHE